MSKPEQLLLESYINSMQKGIEHFKEKIREECEIKDYGRDGDLNYKMLYEYAETIINKQNALLEIYENKEKENESE